MQQDEVLALYQREGAVWFFDYDGDPTAPHMEPTMGICTDGYVDWALIMSNPGLLQSIGFALAKRLWQRNIYPDWVVGSYEASTFSYELARQMGARHGHTEKGSIYSEYTEKGSIHQMLWQFEIPAGAVVLQAEKSIRSFGMTFDVREAIERQNPVPVTILPMVATFIYRPPQLGVDTPLDVIALVQREVKSWRRDGCPLCAQGSPPLRPKAHWTELTKKK